MDEMTEKNKTTFSFAKVGREAAEAVETLHQAAKALESNGTRMGSFTEAPESVIDLAQELIRLFHPDLMEARIGFLMRTKPSSSQGRRVLAKAEKIGEKHKLLLDLDFLIWIDEEEWTRLGDEQRRALVDHELCHCDYNSSEGKASIRGHDVEEFATIIERYGAWNPALLEFTRRMNKDQSGRIEKAGDPIIQQLSMLPPRGQVIAADPGLAEQIEAGCLRANTAEVYP